MEYSGWKGSLIVGRDVELEIDVEWDVVSWLQRGIANVVWKYRAIVS